MKKLNIFKQISGEDIKKFASNKKIWIIVAIVVVVIIAAFLLFGSKKDEKSVETVTAEVTRGNIENVIEGSGQVQAINQYEITSLAKGDIIADYFEEGDYVEKGQLLYEIDSSSAKSNIQKAQSSVERAQLSYDQAADSVKNLNIRADISGVITELKVKKGDMVGNNSVVAKIIDKDNLLIRIPFTESDAKKLYIGQSADIHLENTSYPLKGTISRVATGSTINSYGVSVTLVEVDVKNPGSVVPGDRATVIAGDYACNDSGEFEYKNESQIISQVSGKAIAVNYSTGDKVEKNACIIALESDSTISSEKTNRLSLNDAHQSLQDAIEVLEDYKITAPSDGKVLEKTAKAGEKLDQNASAAMAIIADLSTLTFEMSIDELDITKIKVGQKVNVVADAIENKVFEGEVTNIKYTGTASQGVTSYPVTVTIKDSEDSGLIPGMNVTGSVIVESVENVVRVPVSAVRRGGMVIVKDDGKTSDEFPMPSGGQMNIPEEEKEKMGKRLESMKSQLNVPDGYKVVMVQTGLSNDTFVEIKSGLSKGQIVLLPDVTSGNAQQNAQGGFGGMMGGGMPGGGMPSGGMPGGRMPSGGMPSGGMSGGNRGQAGMR